MCAFFWKSHAYVLNDQHSFVLLIATVVCGGIGGIANVTYWALASRYDVHCIKAVSIGMTVGGLVTQAIAVGQ